MVESQKPIPSMSRPSMFERAICGRIPWGLFYSRNQYHSTPLGICKSPTFSSLVFQGPLLDDSLKYPHCCVMKVRFEVGCELSPLPHHLLNRENKSSLSFPMKTPHLHIFAASTTSPPSSLICSSPIHLTLFISSIPPWPMYHDILVDEQNGRNHTAFNSFMNKNGSKWRLRFLQIVSHLIALSLLALLLIVPIRNRETLPADHPFHNDWFYDSQGMVIKMPILLLSSALLVYHAVMDENVQSILLTNPIMVHFGDTSYVLYLVHYPVLRLVKYHFEIVKYGIWDGIAVFVASVVLSELLHWLIDSHFRAIHSRKLSLKLLVCLYILCGLLLLPTYFGHQNDVPSPVSQQNETHI